MVCGSCAKDPVLGPLEDVFLTDMDTDLWPHAAAAAAASATVAAAATASAAGDRCNYQLSLLEDARYRQR